MPSVSPALNAFAHTLPQPPAAVATKALPHWMTQAPLETTLSLGQCPAAKGKLEPMEASYEISALYHEEGEPNIIKFKGPLTPESADLIMLHLNEAARGYYNADGTLNEDKLKEPLTFVINSPGGCLSSTLNVLDSMEQVKKLGIQLHTHTDYMACSAGASLLAAGMHRTAAPGANIMIHESSQIVASSLSSFKSAVKHLDELDKKFFQKLHQIMLEKGNPDLVPKTLDAFKDWLRSDQYFTAEGAQKMGLIDEVKGSFIEGPSAQVREAAKAAEEAAEQAEAAATEEAATHHPAEEGLPAELPPSGDAPLPAEIPAPEAPPEPLHPDLLPQAASAA